MGGRKRGVRMGRSNGVRQAGSVPFRRQGKTTEFCLITAMRSGSWGFPKGNIDPGDTPEQTALKEALEEAGLRGRIKGDPLGQYSYSKWGQKLNVRVYLMEVTCADDEWEEREYRRRCWADAESALQMLEPSSLREMLEEAVSRLNGG